MEFRGCPKPEQGGSKPDLTGFVAFLKRRYKSEGTIYIYTQGMLYFYSLVDIEGDFSNIGCMASMYKRCILE